MEHRILFAVPIGIIKHPELATAAAPLFERRELFGQSDEGLFFTTIPHYSVLTVSPEVDDPVIPAIKEAITAGARDFAAGLGYDVDRYTFEVPRLWMNRMRSGSEHRKHAHYGFTLSGCFYVNTPVNADSIRFWNPMSDINKPVVDKKEYTPFTATAYDIPVSAGDMVFWESYLCHEVPTAEFDGLRLTMAFDVNAVYKR